MQESCSIIPPARPLWQRPANFLAIVMFLAAAGLLAWVEFLVWHGPIASHVSLVRRVPVDAVVLTHCVDVVEAGRQTMEYPYAICRYVVDGQSFQSDVVIRHPGGAGVDGQTGFWAGDGPGRAKNYLEQQYPVGAKRTAWIDPIDPRKAMLDQPDAGNFIPYLFGLGAALFIPIIWVFFASVLALVWRPTGRWVGFGWGFLTLASAGPLVWHYQQQAEMAEVTVLVRTLHVWLGLAAAILLASLLPRPFRAGLGCGLVLCFVFFLCIGTVSAVLIGKFQGIFGGEIDPNDVFVKFLEYALLSGIVLGLLVGIGAWTGAVTIRSDE